MFETDKKNEKYILCAVETKDNTAEENLEELKELVKTAGGVTLDTLIQKREKAHPAHYLGKGKILELIDLISLTGATAIACDDELTGTQQKNLAEALDVKILDRTMIILDIFAGRAKSAEGKVQVELAQLKYNAAHLIGLGKQLSRLGGGIGTRGPGEKKLEMDRRFIKERVLELTRELEEIEKHRELLRSKRKKTGTPLVSLIGYTNSGKSTLMNTLSDAKVLAEDKLFATLDTVTRKIGLPNGQDVLVSDTVGFIQKLPHALIKSFRATLEELNNADILLHVVDVSSPYREMQMKTVYETLASIKCTDKQVITIFNKIDKDVLLPYPHDEIAVDLVSICAITGQHVELVKLAIEDVLKKSKQIMTILIPFSEGNFVSYIYNNCEIVSETHVERGTIFDIYANSEIESRFKNFVYTKNDDDFN